MVGLLAQKRIEEILARVWGEQSYVLNIMVDDKEQVTKNQHYVPQFYLKKFVNIDGKLEILDCKRRKVVASRTTKSVCNEEYFYSVNNELDEVSQILEKELQRIESNISKVYDEMSRKFVNFEQITEEDKMLVATFMSLQYLRGPYMRKQIHGMNEQIMKQFAKMQFSSPHIYKSFDKYEIETGKKLTEKQRQRVIKFAQSEKFNVKMSNAAHLNFIGEVDGFRNLLFAKDWFVYISKSSKKFITSDNPVIELFPDWTGKFFYGPSFFQRTHQFAMTPEILIVATSPRKQLHMGQIKRKTLFENIEHNNKILELNFSNPRNAIAYAYASDKEFLQNIVDSANLYDKQQMYKIRNII